MGYSNLVWGVLAGVTVGLIAYGLSDGGIGTPLIAAAATTMATAALTKILELTWEMPKAKAEQIKARAEEVKARAEELRVLVSLLGGLPEEERSMIALKIAETILSRVEGESCNGKL